MNKRDMALLERAFDAEVAAALRGVPSVMQTKATARADALVADGFLKRVTQVWRGVKVEGYELTPVGHMTYCMACEPEPSKEQ